LGSNRCSNCKGTGRSKKEVAKVISSPPPPQKKKPVRDNSSPTSQQKKYPYSDWSLKYNGSYEKGMRFLEWRDREQAIRCFKKCAKAGHPGGIFMLQQLGIGSVPLRPSKSQSRCRQCGGKGFKRDYMGRDNRGNAEFIDIPCSHCGGSGYI